MPEKYRKKKNKITKTGIPGRLAGIRCEVLLEEAQRGD